MCGPFPLAQHQHQDRWFEVDTNMFATDYRMWTTEHCQFRKELDVNLIHSATSPLKGESVGNHRRAMLAMPF